jgi:phosphoglycerol transferase MdoB-like AlkP superfamily enzyme
VTALQLLLAALVQAENYVLYVHQPSDGAGSALAFLLLLPALQVQHLAVAGGLAVLGAWSLPRGPARWAWLSLFLGAQAYAVVDQVAYKLFFTRLSPSLSEQPLELGAVWSSFLRELDGAFALNVLAWAAVAAAATRLTLDPVARPLPLPLRNLGRRGWAAFALWLATSTVACLALPTHDLEQAPLLRLATATALGPPAPPAAEPEDDLSSLRHGHHEEPEGHGAALAAAARRLADPASPPHVVLFVLESVGALQLLDEEGAVRADRAPNLRRLAQGGVLFPRVYSPFPSTARSHLPMLTGGRTITWGSVFAEMGEPYAGPNLVKALEGLGYRSAIYSAGDLTFENRLAFYRHLPYERIVGSLDHPPEVRATQAVHSWGVSEQATWEQALPWVDQVLADQGRFFLHFMTVSTHHPYGVPPGVRGPFPADDRWGRYLNALHFTDAVLGRMLADLQARGVLQDTLFVVIGDHGQAFGRRHAKNMAHKNALYEENVRTFVLLARPGRPAAGTLGEPLRSPRIGSIGDLYPTVLARVRGASPDDVPGQDLLASDHEPRLAFFHKIAGVQGWGLTDGQFKFMADMVGPRAELYDLAADPGERTNLADAHPDRVALYRRLCANWYLRTNAEFVAHLADPSTTVQPELDLDDLSSPGPKAIAFGHLDTSRPDDFAPTEQLPANRPITAWTHWTPYAEEVWFRYRWTSPSGVVRAGRRRLRAGHTRSLLSLRASLPLEPGVWRLSVHAGNRFLQAEFSVDG